MCNSIQLVWFCSVCMFCSTLLLIDLLNKRIHFFVQLLMQPNSRCGYRLSFRTNNCKLQVFKTFRKNIFADNSTCLPKSYLRKIDDEFVVLDNDCNEF